LVIGCGGNDAEQSFNEKIDLKTVETVVQQEATKNTYDTLNVATYITKIEDTYFIADCYHDQIIYNDNLSDPISDWKVLTNEVHYAHTIMFNTIKRLTALWRGVQ
jgi:hypothetical protein